MWDNIQALRSSDIAFTDLGTPGYIRRELDRSPIMAVVFESIEQIREITAWERTLGKWGQGF
jgi:hypothetical protein